MANKFDIQGKYNGLDEGQKDILKKIFAAREEWVDDHLKGLFIKLDLDDSGGLGMPFGNIFSTGIKYYACLNCGMMILDRLVHYVREHENKEKRDLRCAERIATGPWTPEELLKSLENTNDTTD